MKVEDTIAGQYYTFLRKNPSDSFEHSYFIGIREPHNNKFGPYLFTSIQYFNSVNYNFNGSEEIREIRVATEDERRWLDSCIKSKRFVSKPKEIINNSYSLY